MFTLKNTSNKTHFRLLTLCLLFVLFQGCKLYQDPISVNQAANSEEKGYLKITLQNGDEFIYEAIEIVEGNYYGVHTKNGEKVKTLLLKDDIKDVQRHNKKGSTGISILGISIVVLSIITGVLMF